MLASSETAWADDRKKKGAGKARGSDQSARNDASKKSRPENSRSSAAISRHESSPMAAHSGSGGSPYAARSEHSQPIAGGGGLSTAPEAARVNLGKPLPSLYNGWNARNFDDIQNDENAHVAFLVNALGANARPMPNFQNLEQANIKDFAHVSRNLENTGVAAYLGALPILAGSTAGLQYVPAAASIALIEARHAGYLNTLVDLVPSENIAGNVVNFEVPLSAAQVVSIASPFFVDLNGGPPLIPAGGLSNPIDVLNFALALEYLESAFYDINVPRFAHLLER